MTINYGDLEGSAYMIARQEAEADCEYVECPQCESVVQESCLINGICTECDYDNAEQEDHTREEW